MMTTPKDLDRALAKVEELLTSVNADLAAMPVWKRGSRWHTDRTAQRRRLLAQRDDLRDRRRTLAASN
jgi:hypothetical protein